MVFSRRIGTPSLLASLALGEVSRCPFAREDAVELKREVVHRLAARGIHLREITKTVVTFGSTTGSWIFCSVQSRICSCLWATLRKIIFLPRHRIRARERETKCDTPVLHRC